MSERFKRVVIELFRAAWAVGFWLLVAMLVFEVLFGGSSCYPDINGDLGSAC